MDTLKSQADRSSRRRSMLPQRADSKSSSTHLHSLHGHVGTGTGEQSTETDKPQSSRPGGWSQEEAQSILPPAKIGRSSSSREQAKEYMAKPRLIPSKACELSADRPPSSGSLVSPARARINSAKSNAPTTNKAPFHGRSASQHVAPTATPHVTSFRTQSRAQSFFRSHRPAFSAMQQHFTTQKINKSRPVSPISKPTSRDQVPSSDIFHLQMELAQVHLLHRSAATVQAQWEQSSKDTFQHRFDALCERHTELKEIAQQQQILVNHLALIDWSQGWTGSQIGEKIQLLSRNISDVCNLIDAEGKYTRILEIFESWFTQALDIRGQREAKTAKAQAVLDFNEGIGDEWKAEAMVLERELAYCLRDLKGFGNVRHSSSLGRVLLLYSKLVASLLEELDVIQWIENEIMVQETSWLKSTIDKLASNVSENIGSIASMRVTDQR